MDKMRMESVDKSILSIYHMDSHLKVLLNRKKRITRRKCSYFVW